MSFWRKKEKDNNLVGNILCSMEEICYVSIPIFKNKQGVAPQWAICLYIFTSPNEASYEHLTADTLELHVKKKNVTIITTWT